MSETPPIVTLLSDFGGRDAYVGIMKGVLLGICSQARLVDLTHEVPPQGIVAGALLLRSAVGAFSPGTIHLAVVDPGVGSERHPVVVETETALLVGPDNGLLYPAAVALGVRQVRRITQAEFFRHPVSQTFHGRDLFAPVAGHLAAGVPVESFGPEVPNLQPLEVAEPTGGVGELRGEVIWVDHFGNLITNIPRQALADLASSSVSIRIGGMRDIPLVGYYASVPEGEPLAIIGSWDLLELSVRNGSAAAYFSAGVGTQVFLVQT